MLDPIERVRRTRRLFGDHPERITVSAVEVDTLLATIDDLRARNAALEQENTLLSLIGTTAISAQNKAARRQQLYQGGNS